MGIRELIDDIKKDTDKYFKERDPLFAEMFFMGYCAANCDLSNDRLDRNFYNYFEYWMPRWIKDNIAPPNYIKDGPFFQGHRRILPKGKEEFTYFLELCELCIQDYDNGGSVIHFPWSKKRSQEEYHDSIRITLLHEIKPRPQMYSWNLRMDLAYYKLQGHCLAHREAGIPAEEIDATFCQEFGEWLLSWIRENIDQNYMPQSQYWYEDICRILPEGKKELNYFLELCELFFQDYGVRKGFDPYEIPESYLKFEPITIKKVDVIPSWRPRKPMKCLILITDSETISEDIYCQWKAEGKNIGCESGDFAMELRRERIYVWLEGDSLTGYDDSKLQLVDISHPYFYTIRYSDRKVMKYFIKKSNFPKGSYLDNDECILPLEEIKEDIEGFIL